MKYVILHADGIGDVPRPELEGRTPLQVAATPHLDRIAQSGESGVLSLPSDGARVGSEVTAMAVLGYDPRKYYTGPGPLEAASLGVSVGEHDVVFRCTMVTLRGEQPQGNSGRYADLKKLGPHVMMDDATAGLLQTDQARELIEAVNEQLGSETIQFYPGSGHRHLMVWVGGKVRSVCVDPQQVVGRGVADSLPSGDGADVLRRLMEASIVILREHPVNNERQAEGLKPANCLWLWGQGRAPAWPPITERYQLSGTVIASSDVHRGVGISAGLDSLDLSQDEPSSSSPYSRYGEGLAQELARKDFLYVHAGLADHILHSSDAKTKVQAVEQFDRDMVGPVLQELGKHEVFRLLVICDSGLPVANGHPMVPPMYAFSHGPLHWSAGVKRLDEVTVKAQNGPSRDATKFPARLFSRGS